MNHSEENAKAAMAAQQQVAREIISRTSPEDYDGHTEFARMTPAERLAWLDQAVLFIESRRQPQGRWQVAETSPRPQ
jgi:hypothetical protein